MNNFKFWKLSIKELRGSFNEFKIVITSIFLGIFIISAVGSLSENLKFEINNQRSELLGGSFELSTTYQKFPQKIKKWLEVNGKVSEVIELRTMLSSSKNSINKRRLVELKAVLNKAKFVELRVCDKISAFLKENFIEDLTYFEKKNNT